MDNQLAIINFKEKNNLNPDRRSTLPPFECIISYKSKIGNPITVANVRLVMDGIEFGNIEIDETDDITLEKYHLSFKFEFQQYRFNSDNNRVC